MIVMGYPGIGKSTYAKVDKSYAIDLESSLFPDKATYVDVALDLEAQGYIVFVSCHDEVRDLLRDKADQAVQLAICYPSLHLKSQWDRRLSDRLEKDPSDKNMRAYQRFKDHFEEDMRNINKSKKFERFTKLEIQDVHYRFYTLRAYKYPYGSECVRRLGLDYSNFYGRDT